MRIKEKKLYFNRLCFINNINNKSNNRDLKRQQLQHNNNKPPPQHSNNPQHNNANKTSNKQAHLRAATCQLSCRTKTVLSLRLLIRPFSTPVLAATTVTSTPSTLEVLTTTLLTVTPTSTTTVGSTP